MSASDPDNDALCENGHAVDPKNPGAPCPICGSTVRRPDKGSHASQGFAGRLEAFADPAQDLFYSAWISLLNAIGHTGEWSRFWARRQSQEAMLWAALSAEGRINEFLMGTLDGQDLKAL